ncbi:MAG: helix-hairpin-helix domain-containing protein [Pyrinomonadaceae bacterium]
MSEIGGINYSVANRLEEVAQILEEQRANTFRVNAYRRAASTLRGLEQPIDEIVRSKGLEGLQGLPGIGETLARFIHQIVTTGRLPMLDRLRGECDPIALLRTVPGIGRVMAGRLHDELGIESLEELEIAAHDGRLAKVFGFGEKRLAGIRDSLATRLGRVRTGGLGPIAKQPTVSEILDVDREYRQKSAQELLPKIAPRRFNPWREKWLPILHTNRGTRHYTVLFSNTARAHELDRTSNWVVIYYDGRAGERQCTVITCAYGPLAGSRIIRGREAECMNHYLHPIVSSIDRRKVQNGFSL